MTKEKLLKIGQWLTIILLAIVCLWLWVALKHKNKSLIDETQYQKNNKQYVVISQDKTLGELKKINEELYDSIKKLSDVKEAIQIKYITQYQTDTVVIDNTYIAADSVYHYAQTSDTINYNLDICGKDVQWFKLGFSVQDSLMIVTRSKDGQNETTISHSNNTTITNATVFVPEKSFIQKIKENTYFGVGIGAGYGVINKKPDIYIGINAGIRF